MRVHLAGVRGSTPATGAAFARYGGDTSCVAIAHDGADPVLVLDAGTGLARVTALLDGPFRGTILLGHLHWDHTHGLPFFRAGDRDDATVRLRLPAAEGLTAEKTLARVLSPPHFPITPAGLRGRWTFDDLAEGRHETEGFVVHAREIPHPGGRTLGFRVSDGHSSVAYLTDHGPVALGPGPDGFGPYHDAALALARDVDVLIHDAQYTAGEFDACRAFGHSSVDYALGLADAAGAGRLVLFHHDPSRTDDRLDAIAATLPAGAVVARQGDVIRPRVLVQ
ncbi:MBL fold metallo-hydrolase [Pseudonocardia endophytica]|uniref:Phosphoribosyl 1,2-cyclic phosphodiesterase n=1 Tax=Pseudonocardia endophytica TaxID=401976 RepID=A0A4R1HRV4_PSEEN|nr:MBL fold metallo-hydrolase [Pseudonocardia endophytica]TCK25337.1 phosphoribosyl 1,2-cyclic phosphodiesterase [Pseudonocardia endophytica]